MSDEGSSLVNPPIIEFSYIGASITSTRITSLSPTSASISIATSKPVLLWGLYSIATTSIRPSALVVMTQGQVESASASSTHHFILPDLQPQTRYVVYFAGKEVSGTLMHYDENCMITVTTPGESSEEEDFTSKSDGSICVSGWGTSSTLSDLQLLPCSNHGYCKQRQCM